MEAEFGAVCSGDTGNYPCTIAMDVLLMKPWLSTLKEHAMENNSGPIVNRSLFSWVFAGNLKLQLLLLLIVVVAVIARVVPLEMQKRIVNEAIQEKNIVRQTCPNDTDADSSGWRCYTSRPCISWSTSPNR
jgi:hypothetical protein